MGDRRNSKFSAGLVLGAIIGGLSAFLLSPKTGKENRKMLAKKYKELQDSLEDINVKEKVDEIFGDASEESMKLFKTAKKELSARLEDLKSRVADFDQEKYSATVDEVMDQVKGQLKSSSKHIGRLREYFMENWSKSSGISKSDTSKKSKKKS